MKLTDYYLELIGFIALLNDGHTFVRFPKSAAGTKSLPAFMRPFTRSAALRAGLDTRDSHMLVRSAQ